MPFPSFADIKDKATTAIQASPLGSHLPSGNRPTSPDAATQPSANEAAGGSGRSHTFGALHHQLRALGQQYTASSPAQRIITSSKGVAIDSDSLARDSKTVSKELYTWGQTEPEDLKDVTDRLAYLNYLAGALAGTLAEKLDAARTPFKQLRDAETALAPRRNIRTGFATQITRLESDNAKSNYDKKIADLKAQLQKAEYDDEPQEREILLLKRKAVRESEQLKWEAFREYAEKLALVSQSAPAIIDALPVVPPSEKQPYSGAHATGAARASLQRALDTYQTGHVVLPITASPKSLSRSDTMSFGDSHASELDEMHRASSDMTFAANPNIPMTPPLESAEGKHGGVQLHDPPVPQPSSSPVSIPNKSQSPPIDPSALNNSPAPIPASSSPLVTSTPLSPGSLPHSLSETGVPSPGSTTVPLVVPQPEKPVTSLPPVTPTMAETGVPVVAGEQGPGPASGSLSKLREEKLASPPAPFGSAEARRESVSGKTGPAAFESAEDEKKRLAQEYSVAGQATPTPTLRDEEKARIERERLARGPSTTSRVQGEEPKDGEELPPYQDM